MGLLCNDLETVFHCLNNFTGGADAGVAGGGFLTVVVFASITGHRG